MKCIKNLVVVSFSALCFSMSPGTASARGARVASASLLEFISMKHSGARGFFLSRLKVGTVLGEM
jgi:hypothetical protein